MDGTTRMPCAWLRDNEAFFRLAGFAIAGALVVNGYVWPAIVAMVGLLCEHAYCRVYGED